MNKQPVPGLAALALKPGESSRLGLMLLVSVLLHALILTVHFAAPALKQLPNPAAYLEVVLVNSKSASKPVKADALAQANLDGGGNTEANRRAKSPLPNLDRPHPDPALEQREQRVVELEQQARRLMTQAKSKQSVAQSPNTTASPQHSEAAVKPNAAELVQRSLEAARLEAQISRDWDNYQKLPRRKFIGARTQEYRFARYVEDWRMKVEKVGNLNYPEAAKQQKLYGQLQLTVSIRADGSVEGIEINRSSGQKVLDAAARRIVELAGPFSPLPDNIRKDTDILSITRTWIFTSADQLSSE
ncbi:MAG: energy transducer TonB [Sulfurimicrobium sp.]|nr:energy transducer TonB [Sulfurimicrobium sp.]MDP1705929.1 energy transducer TonB [Sulfurimicrobium sp.]MDP2198457.1 energy transducer TonB [Sulfurimicrobium sp.]